MAGGSSVRALRRPALGASIRQTAIKAGTKGRIGMREDNGATRDVARTYREALGREKKDLPAYNKALSVYLGHFPTMSHDAARQAVAEIIAADFQNRERGH